MDTTLAHPIYGIIKEYISASVLSVCLPVFLVFMEYTNNCLGLMSLVGDDKIEN